MKTCQDILEIYSAYIDGEATPGEVQEMEAHLQTCPDCRDTADQLRGLSRSVRDDSTDYLRVSSNTLASLVLVKPELVSRWPSGREVLLTKILPTVGIGAWSLAIFHSPLLYRAWPLFGLGAFLLAQRQAGTGQVGSSLSSTLRPFNWGLLAMTLLPTSAMLASTGIQKTTAEEPVGAGLAIAVATAAGALCGIWRQHCDAAAWKRWRLPLVVAGLVFLTLGCLLSKAALVVALLTALWLMLRLNRDLSETSVLPSYSPMALLVDVGSLFALYAIAQFDWSDLTTSDFRSELKLDRLDWSCVVPLLFGCGWLLLRNPVSALLEHCHGRKVRWWVGGVLGIVLALIGWMDLQVEPGVSPAAQTVGLGLAGLFLGLLAASRAAKPLTPLRKSVLAQRLRVTGVLWLGALLAVVTLPGLWDAWATRHWPARPEPARAAQLRRQPVADSPPDPQARTPRAKAETFLNKEIRLGLNTMMDGSWYEHKPGKLIELKENFKHIDQAIAAGATEDAKHGWLMESISDALWLRVYVELGDGRNAVGFQHLWETLNWQASGQVWAPLSYGASDRLRRVLRERRLTAAQYRQLWNRFQAAGGGLPRFRAAVDRAYQKVSQECLARPQQGKLNLPLSYYQAQLADVADYYLVLRERVDHDPEKEMPDSEVPLSNELKRELWRRLQAEQIVSADFETTLATLGVCLYRAEKGHFPERLEQVEHYLGRQFLDYRTGKKVRYRVYDPQLVLVGNEGFSSVVGFDDHKKLSESEAFSEFLRSDF